jgi:hypothetical protein
MCIVCKDWLKGKMTPQEAIGALGEMIKPKDNSEENEHMKDLKERIEGYVETSETD